MFIRHIPGQSAILTVMMRSAEYAAKSLSRDFEELEQLQVSKQGTYSFVKASEEKATKSLIKDLTKARPEYGLLIEGKKEIESKDGIHRWIVDHLDGTNNFGHGIPLFAISIALEKNGEIISGVVYDIIHHKFYFAEKGFGCYMNGRRLRVSGRSNLDQCMMITNYHLSGSINDRVEQIKNYFKTTTLIAPELSSFRSFGAISLDLAFIASGKCDGAWLEDFNIWDVAAGIILIKEAGGFVTGFDGKTTDKIPKNMIAANPTIHHQLTKVLKK